MPALAGQPKVVLTMLAPVQTAALVEECVIPARAFVIALLDMLEIVCALGIVQDMAAALTQVPTLVCVHVNSGSLDQTVPQSSLWIHPDI